MKPAEASPPAGPSWPPSRRNRSTRPSLRSDVVTLYQGGLYHLYRYKKYTDVRLVLLRSTRIALFGGDTDNFEFPRFNLDICFFRVYEDGKPVQAAALFKWSKAGPKEGDLVFVTGHPGIDQPAGHAGQAQASPRRDAALHRSTGCACSKRCCCNSRERGPEQAAHGQQGPAPRRQRPQGLQRASIRACSTRPSSPARQPRRASLLRQDRGRPGQAEELRRRLGHASPRREKAFAGFERELSPPRDAATPSTRELFHIARHLVRLAAEQPKPNAERLREYRDSALESLEFQLFSPAPIYRRAGARQAGRLADVPGGEPGRRASAGRQDPGRQIPGRPGRPN